MMIVLDKLIKLLEEQGPPALKGRYYIGQIVYSANRSLLPLATIRFTDVGIQPDATTEDRVAYIVEIDVLTAWLDKVGNDTSRGYSSLLELIGVLDDSYNLKPKTILYALSNNKELDHNLRVGVGETPSVTVDFKDIYDDNPNNLAVRAVVTFSVTHPTVLED